MIKTPFLLRFHNDEHIQFNKDVLTVCEDSNTETLQIQNQFDALKAGTEHLESSFLHLRGSELTQKIIDEDEKRDELIIGIEKVADGFTRHFNPKHAEAADLLLRHIQKYGHNIARMNYQAETTALNDLIDFVKNDKKMQTAVSVLGFNEWFEKLEEYNTQFNRLYIQRVKEEAGKPVLSLKVLRKDSIQHFKDLSKYIEAQALINPSEQYETVMKEINKLIDKYNRLRRKSKGNGAQTDDDFES